MYKVTKTKERNNREMKNVRTMVADERLLSLFRLAFMISNVFIRMNG